MVAVAVICTPASVIVASMDRMEVMRWLDAPKRRPMISGTVVAIARRKSGAMKATRITPIPADTTYQPADKPQEPYAFAATPTVLPPPISVAANVPAVIRTPIRRPASR